MVPDQGQTLRQIIIIRYDDTAFASVNMLVIIQRENTDVAKQSGLLAIQLRSRRLRTILDDLEIVPLGDLADTRRIEWLTEQIDDQDRLVRGVTAASMEAGSRQNMSGSTSANTGTAP